MAGGSAHDDLGLRHVLLAPVPDVVNDHVVTEIGGVGSSRVKIHLDGRNRLEVPCGSETGTEAPTTREQIDHLQRHRRRLRASDDISRSTRGQAFH